MDKDTDSFRRFLNGDEAAFDEIMESLFRRLVFFIEGYVRDIHTAEDLAMDAFAELIAHKHRYNFSVTLKTYLFMIGRSRALDYLRHRRVIGFTGLNALQEQADGETLEKAVLADERKRAVSAAVAALPEDMRTVIHLVYFEDMTYAQAARVMKKSVKQVDNLLYRAKKALRVRLGGEGGGEYERA